MCAYVIANITCRCILFSVEIFSGEGGERRHEKINHDIVACEPKLSRRDTSQLVGDYIGQ